MEAAARAAYLLITGQEPPALFLNLTPVHGLDGVKEAAADIPGVGTLRVAVCHGMANGRKVLDAVRAGKAPWHFVEFMTCPGGCIAGGGQPCTAVPPTDAIREQRLASLYKADASLPKRKSYENAEVAALYQNFLEHPMSELAEERLHTEYLPAPTSCIRCFSRRYSRKYNKHAVIIIKFFYMKEWKRQLLSLASLSFPPE